MYILQSNDDTSFSLCHPLDGCVRPMFYWMTTETSKALLLLLIEAGRFTTHDALGSALFVFVNTCKWVSMHILSSLVVNICYFARQHGPLWRQHNLQSLSWPLWDIRSPLCFWEGFIYYHVRLYNRNEQAKETSVEWHHFILARRNDGRRCHIHQDNPHASAVSSTRHMKSAPLQRRRLRYDPAGQH